ncbi:DUF6588 family protein [Mucilaginibacter myungsuensis]|uniref:Outer membrane protein with beta-barrel domain n=1 Tax=Mucilaginibacter myungsuensis TaxID=649104 RepID=A0A929L0A0_9SPHI|nr:DUF6588 family protein [Mucilaginibacter myungsuensis]MBE9663233.1 hypothetical protein [Mucilaginibacter myungsuensis]MDN3598866.1 hypothetical protein [Mucilaginibacter myungsuensis]
MKKLYSALFVAASLICAQKASAQDEFGDLFKGGPGDVNKLLNAYTKPLFKGFGNGLNGGWTNTAKTLDLLHFDIRISATASIVADADKAFDINSLGLANIKPTNSGQSTAATFGGNENLQTGITYTDPSNPLAKFSTTLPGGVSQYIPAPQVQVTVGLIKHTDVTVRFFPETKISDDAGKVGMIGFGLKHNIAGTFKTLPFDLAVALGYTRLKYDKALEVRPEANNAGVSGNQNYADQRIEGHFSGWNAQLIISKKLLFFTPFASVGYLTSKTDVGLKGNFPFVTGANVAGRPSYTVFTDPISIAGTGVSVDGLRADLGFQIKIPVLRLYGSYSFAEYQSANVGIGFGF